METEEENHYSLSPLHPSDIPNSIPLELEELLQNMPVPSTETPSNSLREDTTHQSPTPSYEDLSITPTIFITTIIT